MTKASIQVELDKDYTHALSHNGTSHARHRELRFSLSPSPQIKAARPGSSMPLTRGDAVKRQLAVSDVLAANETASTLISTMCSQPLSQFACPWLCNTIARLLRESSKPGIEV